MVARRPMVSVKLPVAYNYWYINQSNLNTTYDWYINGQQPLLTVLNVSGFTGSQLITGNVVNLAQDVKIYSGSFLNLSANTPFTFSGLQTGLLNVGGVGNYYLLPGPSGSSAGNYSGQLQLITNGGIESLLVLINITGTPTPIMYSLDLNGVNVIPANSYKTYLSNITCNSGSGMPVLVSLSYVTGNTGNYYTGINVSTGISGLGTGYITNFGYIMKYLTGEGTGRGGLINSFGTGLASGTLNGLQYATGSIYLELSNISNWLWYWINFWVWNYGFRVCTKRIGGVIRQVFMAHLYQGLQE